jgi:transposase, IS30 family
MPKGYSHLTYEQRCQIYALKQRGDSPAAIAKELGVNRSTIGREFGRNSGQKGYRYKQAQEKSKQRKLKVLNPNQKLTPPLIGLIEKDLRLQWSPVQISGRLKKQGIDISHETIYTHIWKDKHQGGTLYKELRHHGKKYNKRSKGTAGRGCIPGRVDIGERPSIVEEKTRLGDWELDTIIGAGHVGAIVSMVERASKLTKLVKVSHKTAEEVSGALIKKLFPILKFVLTLTADNGKEFAYHQIVSEALQADFFFATPYHSWERGLNEHTNGLVRQYFPKSASFNGLSDEDVERVETLLNNRPRKILEFETPLEAFQRMTEMDP